MHVTNVIDQRVIVRFSAESIHGQGASVTLPQPCQCDGIPPLRVSAEKQREMRTRQRLPEVRRASVSWPRSTTNPRSGAPRVLHRHHSRYKPAVSSCFKMYGLGEELVARGNTKAEPLRR